MNQSCIVIIILLVLFQANLSFAGETRRIYDGQHNAVGYIVTDNDGNKTYYNNSWDRTGKTLLRENKETHYDINQNRIGHTDWNNDIGTTYDKNHDRTGYIKRKEGKETFYNKNWQRKGYTK